MFHSALVLLAFPLSLPWAPCQSITLPYVGVWHQVSHKAAHILPLDGQQALLRHKLPEVCHLKDRLLVLQHMQLHLRHRHHRRLGQCELF